MAEAIDRVMAELQAAAAAIRARGALSLSPAGMLRLERRAVEVARALLDGEALPEDGTDELLSVEADVAPAQEDQRPLGDDTFDLAPADDTPTDDTPTGDAVATVGVRGAVVASVGDGADDDEEEDVNDEATVITSTSDAGMPNVSWEDALTFVAEEDSEIALEFVASSGPPETAGEEILYVVEEPPLLEVEEDGADDPSDAGLVSFTEGTEPSYVMFEEPPEEEVEALAPVMAAAPVEIDHSLYVSYDEVPVGGRSDADLALGSEDLLDEDEEVTLGSIPRPAAAAAARLPEDEADGPSFSDVGEDALVTIGEEGDDVLGDLDEANAGVETFDLMPDGSEDDPVLEDDEEVTLVTGIEDDGDVDEVDIDDEDEMMVGDSRGSGMHAQVATGRAAAPSPRVTAGLYGNPSVPTIREGNDPVPKAAAVQLNSAGGGRMLGLEEEEEPIELGSVGDYGEDEEQYEGGDGLSIAIQEYEEEEEEEEEEELELDPEPVAPPPPPGPTLEEIQATFDRAQAAAHSGALQDAADLYSDVVDADPDHLDAHVGRGRLYLDLGDYSRAMSDFMVAEEIDESSPEPQVAIGDLYFHRKDYRKAIEYFDTALKMAPNHAMAFCRRGISHYYRKNFREALGDLEKANSLDPDIPNIASFISMAKRKAKSRR